jgi:sugar phosphate isomerase/epimerase
MLGEKANALGLKLAYHNHDFEFEKLGGEYALDILYKEVPASLLQTQLDTCWVNVGGENPALYIRKYAGRTELLHLKDFVGGKSENMYALIGIDEDQKKDTVGPFEFRPVGSGVQDFPAILRAAEEAGTKWVIVEQDQPCLGMSPLECAKASIDYLKTR